VSRTSIFITKENSQKKNSRKPKARKLAFELKTQKMQLKQTRPWWF
jgi:hypothetical protein